MLGQSHRTPVDVKPPGSQSPSNRIWVSTPYAGFSPKTREQKRLKNYQIFC